MPSLLNGMRSSVGSVLAVLLLLSASAGAQVPEQAVMVLTSAGDRAYTSKQFRQASRQYEHALALAPDDVDLKVKLANSYRLQGQLQTAARFAQSALQSAPYSAKALLASGQVAIRQGNTAAAAASFARAAALDAANPSVHLALGNALMQLGEQAAADDAFAAYQRLIEQPVRLGESQE